MISCTSLSALRLGPVTSMPAGVSASALTAIRDLRIGVACFIGSSDAVLDARHDDSLPAEAQDAVIWAIIWAMLCLFGFGTGGLQRGFGGFRKNCWW